MARCWSTNTKPSGYRAVNTANSRNPAFLCSSSMPGQQKFMRFLPTSRARLFGLRKHVADCSLKFRGLQVFDYTGIANPDGEDESPYAAHVLLVATGGCDEFRSAQFERRKRTVQMNQVL